MPKGNSGRLVIEIDPKLKRRLYGALAIDGSTLKQWFIDAAEQYLAEQEQPTLPTLSTNKGGSKKS